MSKIPEQLLREFEPKQEWLAHDSFLHGVGHLARTVILQELICDQLEAQGAAVNRRALRFAAMAHDVGRHDDDIDPEHGTRSAEWIRANLADRMTPEELDIATYVVHWHTPSDKYAPAMTTELQVLKDADALDRVRLGDLDESYLRTDVAKELVEIAEQLYEASLPREAYRTKEAFEDVLMAAKQLGLVQDSKLLCLSAADIHGNQIQYEKIKTIVAEQDVRFVFLSGDLLPKTGGTWTPENKVRTIAMQRAFIDEYFLPYLAELGKLAHVYAVFGNDDFMSNYDAVRSANIPNVTFLRGEVARLPIEDDELYVAGYPYIGVTPFLHKDWEKWDTQPGDIPHKLYRTDGYSSQHGVHYAVDLAYSSETIRQDLEQLAKKSDPKKTAYIFHEAPYDTPLDQIAADNKYIKDDQLHVGSVAIREFIETKQPLVTMHGHIHETFAESGSYMWRVGNSVALAAANDFASDTLSYVLFSLKNPAAAKRLEK